MTRQYKNILYSRQLSRQECKNCLDEIIEILKTRKVLEIEMMFGFAWGNEYKEWTPFIVSPDEITIEIDKAEKSEPEVFTMMTPSYTRENCVAKYFFAMNMTSIWNLISPMK